MKGRVYQISDNFGVFVAVDNKYSALIPAREAKGKYRPGTVLDLRVTKVKEDGKMDVSDREEAIFRSMKMQKVCSALSKNLQEFFHLMTRLHRKSSAESSV